MSKSIIFEEEVVDAAVDFLLGNLKQLLAYNDNLILPVKDLVKTLCQDLDFFREFLKHSKRRNKNEILRDMMKKIRELVYEVEDTVDAYVSEAAMQKGQRFTRKFLHQLDNQAKLRSIKDEMEHIHARLKHLVEESMRFGFDRLLDWEEPFKPTHHVKAPIVEEENVVGFSDEAEKVIGLLTRGSKKLEVISIVGMPGLGKTTFARMIYNHPFIQYEFYYRAWVYISQEYSRKEVFLNILNCFTRVDRDMYEMTDERLAKSLSSILERGKYFIVIDDVWTKEAWDDLKVAFPNSTRGSRILITSQFKNIARYVNPMMEPHNLRFLSDEESWTLLKLTALGSTEFPMELIETGMYIAKQCYGLPLALVVIGGILRIKGPETYFWEKVAKNLDAYLVMDADKSMANLMEMSFNHLPYHLKACFLYLAMFPKDFEIPVWNLVRLWIAEGFIQPKEGMSLEEIAEDYLDDLISTNLVMVRIWRSNGKVKTCHVHDLVHMFCKNQAAKENFFQEIKQSDQVTYSSSKPATEMYRRLCIHSGVLNYISLKPFGPRVRSFLCYSSEEIILPLEHMSSIPKAYKLLRVLDIKPISLTRFPLDVTRLIHLRYLVLSVHFRILPVAFSDLWNLQTLIVVTSSRTLEFKGDILKMIQLRHLKSNAPSHLAKSRKNKDNSQTNVNLRTLSLIAPESCREDVFAGAPKLEKLGIRGDLAKLLDSQGETSLFDGLGKLDHLENLKLLNDVSHLEPSEGKLVGLPPSSKFPSKLKKLTLEETLLDWKHMNTLGKLVNLEILKLKDNAFKGEHWQLEDGGFPALKVLHIGKTDLVSWNASVDHFPRLRSLYLKHCSSLEEIPSGLEDVLTLQTIDLYCTTRSAAASARRIQKKMQHQGRVFRLSIYPPDDVQY